MTITEDTMKVIGVFLIAGLVGCSGDSSSSSAPDAAPGPARDAAPAGSSCLLDDPTCRDWWVPASLTGAAPKSISYNKLGADSLMFNALLRNPRANVAMTRNSLKSLLDTDPPPDPDSDAGYFQRQLQDPFARRTMDYLVGCALPALPEATSVTWTDPVSKNSVTWEGNLGLCPSWQTEPMNQACQELISACLLARNNALDREVLISVRGGQAGGSAALPHEDPVQGGQPCESNVASFEMNCDLTGPNSNCKGWVSGYVGSCIQDQSVVVNVEAESNTSPLIRICHGVSGCDYVDPSIPVSPGTAVAHVASRQISCGPNGPCRDSFTFKCTKKQAFTLMSANGGFAVREVTGGTYPAPEKTVFPWQEGAFYGNLFCGSTDPCSPGLDTPKAPVDFTLWVEVCDDLDEECDVAGAGGDCDALDRVCDAHAPGTVVYQWDGHVNPVYDPSMGPERDLLTRRDKGHDDFLVREGYTYPRLVVYQRMYSCMSPNWAPSRAMADERLCAGTYDATYCAAHSAGRCWSTNENTACQCSVKDVTDGPTMAFPLGDRDYGDCRDDSDMPSTWTHPLTVFLNDPCDIVPESEYADGDDVACRDVPLCRQTTSPTPLQSRQPPSQRLLPFPLRP